MVVYGRSLTGSYPAFDHYSDNFGALHYQGYGSRCCQINLYTSHKVLQVFPSRGKRCVINCPKWSLSTCPAFAGFLCSLYVASRRPSIGSIRRRTRFTFIHVLCATLFNRFYPIEFIKNCIKLRIKSIKPLTVPIIDKGSLEMQISAQF